MDVKRSVVVAGALAQRPRHGGHTWVMLQYVLGFRRLGWDVLVIDRLDDEFLVGSARHGLSVRAVYNVLRALELHDSYALSMNNGREWIGLGSREVLARVASADLLLDINGYLGDHRVSDAAQLRVFVDVDPGFNHMWNDLGLVSVFGLHDRYVTVGDNLCREDCTIPTCGIRWVHMRPPVVLDHWPAVPPERRVVTTVAAWRGPFDPIEHQGQTYGLRVHEFRRFVNLPCRSPVPLELALEIDPYDTPDREVLDGHGWRLVNPRDVAGDPDSYRRYIQTSMAEFMVAKNMYVRSNSGWFSDRSACYLASGKPVVAQDTGIRWHDRDAGGLLLFTTVDEAVAALDEVTNNYDHHSRAARAIAEEHFDSDIVLGKLLVDLGVA